VASHLSIGKSAPSASSPAQRVADAGTPSRSVVNTIALDRGNVLRIQHGAGTRVLASSGVLWITEENSPEDHVLLPGDALALSQNGLAVVLAHRPARVVLSVSPDGEPPSTVEMALADGEPGTRITLAGPASISLSATTRALATAIDKARAMLGVIARTLTSHWKASALSMAGVCAPMSACDGVPPRHRQRGAAHETRKVEPAVNEAWTPWRK
jgi:hypothetical protein